MRLSLAISLRHSKDRGIAYYMSLFWLGVFASAMASAQDHVSRADNERSGALLSPGESEAPLRPPVP